MTEVVEDKTMVERVAEAIWMENRPEMAPSYDELDFMDQVRVRQIAKACIKAMKEPTDEMKAAGIASCDELCPTGGGWQGAIWEKMIDAALKEG